MPFDDLKKVADRAASAVQIFVVAEDMGCEADFVGDLQVLAQNALDEFIARCAHRKVIPSTKKQP